MRSIVTVAQRASDTALTELARVKLEARHQRADSSNDEALQPREQA